MKKLLTESLSALAEHHPDLSVLFAGDTERVSRYSFSPFDIYFDLSKTHIDPTIVDAYTNYANSIELEQQREDLFRGKKINLSERRAVLHHLLRDPNNYGLKTEHSELNTQARAARDNLNEQYRRLNSLLEASEDRRAISDIIHVGIGGSFLGTQLFEQVVGALDLERNRPRVHFVSNIDAHQLDAILHQCRPRSTLVIGVSKTFSTLETLTNLETIREWYSKSQVNNWQEHFIAVTASPDNASRFGIPNGNVVSFPQWVGGRYSVWSSVSLSAILAQGIDQFSSFLQGAREVDEYFLSTPLDENVCFLSAAMDHFYRNVRQAETRAIFAYDFRLRSLVDYLQQLETESNGKDRDKFGDEVEQHTSPVVWGGVGTDVQHSVFQLLHQGSFLIPAEFILVKEADHSFHQHHRQLLANGVAQTAALMRGQTLEEVEQLDKAKSNSDISKKAKIFSGGRPSTSIVLSRLDAKNLGRLLAFYEHRTFCNGALTGINSYDQMGVELGKRLAGAVEDAMRTDLKTTANNQFDQSTREILRRLLASND